MAARKPTPSTEIALAAKAGELALAEITFDQSEVRALRACYKENTRVTIGDKILGAVGYTTGTGVIGLGATAAVTLTGGFILLPVMGMMGGLMLTIVAAS